MERFSNQCRGRPVCLPRWLHVKPNRGGHGCLPLPYTQLQTALIGHKAYAAHLAAARKGRVVERLRVLMRTKDHSDGAAGAQARHELARRKAATAVRRELKYLSANELAK